VLDASPVVPAAVEDRDLSSCWQVGHVALEGPLGPLDVRWLVQCDESHSTWIEWIMGQLFGAWSSTRGMLVIMDWLGRPTRPRLSVSSTSDISGPTGWTRVNGG
jgi:hypothetical protein